MPKKTDPIVRVLDYFENAPLVAAAQALALVRRTVAAREVNEAVVDVQKPAKKRKARRTKAQMMAAKVAVALGDGSPLATVSLRPSRAAKVSAEG